MKLLDAIAGARVYDLAQPLTAATPIAPAHVPFRMALIRRHGDVVREDGSSSANELISLSGHTGTHVDAIAHFAKAGKLHGGVDAAEAARGFRATGPDTFPYEWHAPGAGLTRLPVHVLLLVDHGIHLIEVMQLEDLARDRVYEFLFVLAPLPLVGATGSPVRPLAIVGD